jgi:quinone-modifying oxidoreductase subunit QmoA
MVVGGGISGLTTALEAAEVGYEVFPGGKKSLPGRTGGTAESVFSQAMPSDLRIEINFRRIKDNPRIKVFTLAEVKRSGHPGDYTSASNQSPLCQRKLHLLRRLRRSLPDRSVQ